MKYFGKFLTFQLERWIQRGVFHQLVFVAAIIAIISVGGGLLAWLELCPPPERSWSCEDDGGIIVIVPRTPVEGGHRQ